MARHLRFVAVPLVWLATAATLLAQADPLTTIPDDALGVAVIRDIADTNARIGKLTQKMKIPVPDLLAMAKGFSGVQKGLDENGGMAAAILPDPSDPTIGIALIVAVPVTDYKIFVAQLNPEDADAPITQVTVAGLSALVAKKGNFAIFISSDKKGLLEKVVAAEKNVGKAIEPLRGWMRKQQLAVVVTPAGKKVLFEKILALLPDAPAADDNAAPGTPAAGMQSMMEMLQLGKQFLGAADPQLTHLALGIGIGDDTSLHVCAQALFTPGGSLSAWAKDFKLPPGNMLKGLPPGKFAFAYAGASVRFGPAVSDLINRLSDISLRQFGSNEESRKKHGDVLDRQRANSISSAGLMGLIRPGDTLFAGTIALERVKDAKQHMKLSREVLEALVGGLKSKSTDEPIYRFNDVTVGGSKALEIVVNLNAISGLDDPNNPMAEQMQTFFGKLFSTDGKMRTYLTVADDHTVVSAYTKEQLERAVAHVRSGAKGLEADPQIATTAAMLPSGSQWVAYISPQGVLQIVDTVLRAVLPPEAKITIPDFAATEPIGMAAKFTPAGLEAELVLPESVVAGIGQFVGVVQQLLQGGAPPLP